MNRDKNTFTEKQRNEFMEYCEDYFESHRIKYKKEKSLVSGIAPEFYTTSLKSNYAIFIRFSTEFPKAQSFISDLERIQHDKNMQVFFGIPYYLKIDKKFKKRCAEHGFGIYKILKNKLEIVSNNSQIKKPYEHTNTVRIFVSSKIGISDRGIAKTTIAAIKYCPVLPEERIAAPRSIKDNDEKLIDSCQIVIVLITPETDTEVFNELKYTMKKKSNALLIFKREFPEPEFPQKVIQNLRRIIGRKITYKSYKTYDELRSVLRDSIRELIKDRLS